MTSFVISVGIDPDDLDVQETPDNFGTFPTKEAAASSLLEMINRRMSALRRSKARAQRVIRSTAKAGATPDSN